MQPRRPRGVLLLEWAGRQGGSPRLRMFGRGELCRETCTRIAVTRELGTVGPNVTNLWFGRRARRARPMPSPSDIRYTTLFSHVLMTATTPPLAFRELLYRWIWCRQSYFRIHATAERGIPDPISSTSRSPFTKQRLVRLSTDGHLEFLVRWIIKFKVRGFS